MVQGGPDTAWVGVQPWHCPHPSVLNEWFMKSWKLPPRFQRKVWNARHYGRGRVPAGHSWEGDTWSCAGDICATMETPACWRCQEHMMSSEESHRQWVEQSKKEDSTGKTLEIGFPWMPDAVLHELLFTLMGLTFAWSESCCSPFLLSGTGVFICVTVCLQNVTCFWFYRGSQPGVRLETLQRVWCQTFECGWNIKTMKSILEIDCILHSKMVRRLLGAGGGVFGFKEVWLLILVVNLVGLRNA
jgi:hypothetical protein